MIERERGVLPPHPRFREVARNGAFSVGTDGSVGYAHDFGYVNFILFGLLF